MHDNDVADQSPGARHVADTAQDGAAPDDGDLHRIRSIFADDRSAPVDTPFLDGSEIARFQHAQLTGTLAHELRTPLGSIRASAFMMQRKAAAAGLDMSTAYKRLDNNLRRCNDVIVNLLEKSWSNELQPIELPFDEWLSKLVRAFAEQAPEDVVISTDFAFGDGTVLFDPIRLETAFSNILNNAANALAEMHHASAVPAGLDPEISICSKQTERGVEVSFSNNGPCIPDDEIGRIRQPWVTTEYFGAGIGISYVKCVLEMHLGGLEVDNVAPQGVNFTAWFATER